MPPRGYHVAQRERTAGPGPQPTRTAAGETASRRHPARKSATGPKAPSKTGQVRVHTRTLHVTRVKVGRSAQPPPLAGRKARAPEDGGGSRRRSAPLSPGNPQLFANK